jgi:hypothetical protein
MLKRLSIRACAVIAVDIAYLNFGSLEDPSLGVSRLYLCNNEKVKVVGEVQDAAGRERRAETGNRVSGKSGKQG